MRLLDAFSYSMYLYKLNKLVNIYGCIHLNMYACNTQKTPLPSCHIRFFETALSNTFFLFFPCRIYRMTFFIFSLSFGCQVRAYFCVFKFDLLLGGHCRLVAKGRAGERTRILECSAVKKKPYEGSCYSLGS